ncbi:RNA-directed DNA polymerase from mobile element jockey [Trichonephila clavipes]|nr:RNA-directed DNA polymerase from mobile element jockey [Trichonephila clavipes]
MGDSSPIEAKSIRVAQASEGEPSLPESQRGEEKQEKDKSVEKKKKERGKDHWVPRDSSNEVSVARTDVAATLVSTLFTLNPLCFDVAKAYDQLENTATCSECESLIDALEEIIDTVRKTDGALDDVQKLRLISEVQYVALKVSRKSIRLQNREFKDYIEQIKVLNEKKILTPPSPSKAKRIRNKRTTVSPVPDTAEKKQRASGSVGSGTTTPPPPPTVEEGNLSASMGEESDSESSNSDTEKTKKKIASIVIDASNNTTELLTTLSDYLGSTLEGRFENGKLRVFPKTHLEHRKLQSYLAQKKMRSHMFEMADNKQLKAVIRGLPTDYDQKEIATELKGFGFDADHISILRNRKNNINMPLFLVVLKRTQENKEIFHVTNIGFFRVVVEPLKGSSMPPQCYRSAAISPQNAKNQQFPAKCANCGGPHSANFSGCPSNPVNRKQHKNKPNNNIWTEKAKARAQKATPHQQQPKTYASAVAQNKKETNTFDANAIMEQTGQMMLQWGSMISLLQQNNKH